MNYILDLASIITIFYFIDYFWKGSNLYKKAVNLKFFKSKGHNLILILIIILCAALNILFIKYGQIEATGNISDFLRVILITIIYLSISFIVKDRVI